MPFRPALAAAVALVTVVAASNTWPSFAQGAARPKGAAAVRACADKYADNVDDGERRCIFAIMSDPCSKRREMQSEASRAECLRAEQAIWDDLLNENFRVLREGLDDGQQAKLRDMQRAWIAYRDTTCGFYYDKIQGSMATGMTAACLVRETARRALLLKFFQGL
jgi:uncharacterized protein YecT (DUF1311 family)